MIGHIYTDIQIDFLRKNRHEIISVLADLFNDEFNTNINKHALKQVCLRRGFKSGNDSRFNKGHKPFNKGLKNSTGFSNTRFVKGMERHPTQKPVGSERVDPKDGYIYIKTKDPRTWKPKHVYLWEKKNGNVPKGHCIIFGDNNKRNLEQENFICIKRSELLFINRNGINVNDTNLTKTAISVAKLVEKANSSRKLLSQS